MAFEIKNSGKPRQVRGTTAYKYRNLYAFGVLAVSGLSWWLFEWVFIYLYNIWLILNLRAYITLDILSINILI